MSKRKPKACINCGLELPLKAKYCNECHTYQHWLFRYLPLSEQVLKQAHMAYKLISVGITAATVVYTCHSRTFVSIGGWSDNGIKVNALNIGRQPATLLDCTLTFGDVPITDTAMEAGDGLIPRLNDRMIELTVNGLRAKCRGPEGLWQKSEIEPLLPNGNATLTVHLRESNGDEKRTTKSFPAQDLLNFIRTKLPDRVPEGVCR